MAPKKGNYYFSFHGLRYCSDKPLRVKLQCNGTTQTTSYTACNNVSIDFSAILLLNIGDKVSVRLDEGHLYDTDYEKFITLFGFLLSEE